LKEELLSFEQKGYSIHQAASLFAMGPGAAGKVMGWSWFLGLQPGKHAL
jgi:hypothetical protein